MPILILSMTSDDENLEVLQARGKKLAWRTLLLLAIGVVVGLAVTFIWVVGHLLNGIG